jgi:23S rRNA A2030 N6-methylase RlmJ
MHAFIPEEMIIQAATVIDKHAFTGRYQLNKAKRQAIARRKATEILRIWTLAAADPAAVPPFTKRQETRPTMGRVTTACGWITPPP